jgi:ABC-type multidrug transport system ATPase subunit
VNLAIWLALLEISSIKNSVVSNVLFLDEILEALDAEGVKDTTNLFKEKLNDKNIFVVTQRFDEFQDLFRNQIQFKLNQGFTEIV